MNLEEWFKNRSELEIFLKQILLICSIRNDKFEALKCFNYNDFEEMVYRILSRDNEIEEETDIKYNDSAARELELPLSIKKIVETEKVYHHFEQWQKVLDYDQS